MIPKAIPDPRSFRQFPCVVTDAPPKLGLAVSVTELHRDQRLAATEKMHVRVVEAGHNTASLQIHSPAIWAGERTNIRGGADRHDVLAVDRDRFRLGLARVFGPDLAVEEYESRCCTRRCMDGVG